MGAAEFWTKARGKNAKAAFNTAVEDARYEHGHGGYTGSIAEKSGFVMIDNPGGTPESAEELADKMLREGDKRTDDKWGPAGCIKLRDLDDGLKEYLFFGYASS